MKLDRQYPPMNRHRRDGRLPCAIKGHSWLDVVAVVCIGLPFFVMGLHLFKGLL